MYDEFDGMMTLKAQSLELKQPLESLQKYYVLLCEAPIGRSATAA